MLISWRRNILYILPHWLLFCVFDVKNMIWKCFPVVKVFVGGSVDIASCLLAGFPPHFLGSEGDLGVVLAGTTFLCFFFYWGRYLYCVQLIVAVVTPCVSGNAAAFRLYSGILLVLRFFFFHWHYLLPLKPAVSEPHSRPSAITLKLEAVSDSASGPMCQTPPEPSFVFCLMPWKGERVSFAFGIHVPAPVAGKTFIFTPWAEMHIAGTNNAFSCGCEWRRPQESGRRELLKREHVLNWRFAGMLPLGRSSYGVQYGEQGCCMEGPSHWFLELEVMVAQFV